MEQVSFIGTPLTSSDFSGAHLKHTDFIGVDGISADFSKARLETVIFATTSLSDQTGTCDFRQSSFRRAVLDNVKFTDGLRLCESTFQAANLRSVIFDKVSGTHCDFQNVRAEAVQFHAGDLRRSLFGDAVFVCDSGAPLFNGTTLDNCGFTRISVSLNFDSTPDGYLAFVDCEADNADFQGALLDDCVIRKGSTRSCSFVNASLQRTRFEATVLTGSVFTDAFLQSTAFMGYEGHDDNSSFDLQLMSSRFENALIENARFVHVNGSAAVFTAARLISCTLQDCAFPSAAFDQVVIQGGSLTRTRFTDASMSGLALNGNPRLLDLDCTGARLTGAVLERLECVPPQGSDARPIVLDGADLSDANLSGCVLTNCSLIQATFRDSWLKGARLTNVNLDGATLVGCDMSGLVAEDCFLRGARLLDCSLNAISLTRCDFTGANFLGSATFGVGELAEQAEHWPTVPAQSPRNKSTPCKTIPTEVRATFNECTLHSVDFTNCVLVGASFGSAKLQYSVFRAADLRACRLDGADVRAADFSSARLGEGFSRPAPGSTDSSSEVRLEAASAEGLEAERAGFYGADLSGCNLSNANLSQSRLDNAVVDGTSFAGACFRGASLIGVINFPDIAPFRHSSRPADFSYSYIQATQGFHVDDKDSWERFEEWVNKAPATENGSGQSSSLATEELRRLSWVAWKNNYQSLGLYNEQSECFRQEQLSRGWKAFHSKTLVGQVVLAQVLLAFVLIGGAWIYATLIAAYGENGAFLGASLVSGATVGTVAVVLFRRRRTMRKVVLLASDLLYGFGEEPHKVLINAIFTVAVFGLAYFVATVCGAGGFINRETLVYGEYLFFSATAFASASFNDLDPFGYNRFLAAAESLVGLLMSALFVFALARRTAGR